MAHSLEHLVLYLFHAFLPLVCLVTPRLSDQIRRRHAFGQLLLPLLAHTAAHSFDGGSHRLALIVIQQDLQTWTVGEESGASLHRALQ